MEKGKGREGKESRREEKGREAQQEVSHMYGLSFMRSMKILRIRVDCNGISMDAADLHNPGFMYAIRFAP